MTRRGEGDPRIMGAGLKRIYVTSMTIALGAVMVAASALLYFCARRIQEDVQMDELAQAVRLAPKHAQYARVADGMSLEGGVEVFPVEYGDDKRPGTLYTYSSNDKSREFFELIVPTSTRSGGKALFGIIVATMVFVVLVGAFVAYWVAGKTTRPLFRLIEDVRQISRGDLRRRVHVSGAAEVALLARSIERMTADLEAAQEAQVELSTREREVSLAADVREALLPAATPLIEGYDVGAVHVSSHNLGGDFHDYVEMEDGRVGLLVCDVSGSGMPAALIGATARSYLRSELSRVEPGFGPDGLAAALRRVNRWLGSDVRRGVYVTALYALVDPRSARASVACAGHKIPLLRYSAQDRKLRTIHPEGIALGLDRGAVFDRRLEVAEVPLEVGDRLLLSNSGPVRLAGADGRELGEKALYSRVLKHAPLESIAFLRALRGDLTAFAGSAGIAFDISLVTISRKA